MSREYWDQWLARTSQEGKLDVYFLKELLQHNITTVLDIGSGRGNSIWRLAELGFRVTCVDFSLEAVKYLHYIAQRPSISCMNVVCANLLSLPFCDNAFGSISSVNVMNFFTDESQRVCALEEAFRVVAPGGVMFFSVISCEDEGTKIGEPVGSGNFRLPDGMCLHYFTPSEMEALFKDMDIQDVTSFQRKDTTHDVPHIHSFIRVIAFCEK
jgi:SAM-dependent methyltransferase